MHELFYLAMQTTRWLASIYCGISWSVSGCGASDAGTGNEAAGAQSIAVVQVETVTTVQSAAGSFLSPIPEQVVPAYVESSTEAESAESAEQQERAKVDVALLFRGSHAGSINQELDAQLVPASAAPWSAISHCFPHAEQTDAGVSWPLAVSSVALADLASAISPEWRGWQDFRGLGVRSAGQPTDLRVPAATLDFETRGLSSPLVLSVDGDSLLVTNRSSYAIPRALLIYSHSGGVGVTALEALAPGEQRVTVLGPKEHPPDVLLELAREQLTDFFSASVGPELAAAMASAKSIPFLETQGLRLIALLDEQQETAALSFSSPVSAQQRVIVSHSEILKPEEEARVLSVLTDPSVDAEQALETLGRFTQAKLEFAVQSADSDAST
ncbi:MAG TPA: hypothetical protein VGJ91_07170, partial [Polyangiaceae bacterium]